MKYKKVCPKCGSSSIVRFESELGAYGTGNYISVSALKNVYIHRYVCCDCGYVEEWIDKDDLKRIKESKKAGSVE